MTLTRIYKDAGPMKDRLRKLFIEVKPVVAVVDGEPDAHHVFLQVTNQRFTIGTYAKEDAEWMADMLCVALERIVTEVTEKV